MVCLPCIVIPVVLWVFHKYIQPFILKFWNPWGSTSITASKTGPPEGVDADNPQYKFIQENITVHPVVLFSKTTCRFCKMAKDVLDGTNVEYTVQEISSREDCDAIQNLFAKMTGAKTVPRVFIGQKCIGGGSETWSLHNQGKLVPLMKEAGAVFKETDKKTD